ncbi:MAG: helix-turn-helix transcriptional regulator [Propionibacteriaceae bacterium]|jgi:putative transcriptional regulator|nr:helix-turn-helix transcriptional regulator [Propionibacteriaceae bacterium]
MAERLAIANHIRRLRFFADEMTQQELADRVDCSRQTIVALEAGKYTPSLELAFRIALAFGVPLTDVFECQSPGEQP